MNAAVLVAPVSPRRSIAARILDSFSSGTYAWHALLQVVEVVETTTVETAAVECRTQPKLLINPEFVERHAETSEKLLMLVMHELHHVLLGHTRLFPRVTKLDNLVFDAVINALLCRMFPEPEYVRFFTDYYSADRFPECLLRPPLGWRPGQSATLPAALETVDDLALREIYRGLYSPAGVGYEELYAVLTKSIPAAALVGIRLLGDHRRETNETSSGGQLENRSPLLFGIVREVVEKWPQPPDPIRGRSWNDVLKQLSVAPRRVPTNRERLRKLILQTAGVSQAVGATRQVSVDSFEIQTPLPTQQRRALVLTALGRPPLLHQGTITAARPRKAGPQVHVYLDVSGSMHGLRRALYAAVLDCRAVVHPVIHLFSTEVADVSLAQLRRGDCPTTDGTDVACIAEHACRHRVRRAVLVTDGFVGSPQGDDAITLQRMVLGTALAGCGVTRTDLESVTNFWTELQGDAV